MIRLNKETRQRLLDSLLDTPNADTYTTLGAHDDTNGTPVAKMSKDELLLYLHQSLSLMASSNYHAGLRYNALLRENTRLQQEARLWKDTAAETAPEPATDEVEPDVMAEWFRTHHPQVAVQDYTPNTLLTHDGPVFEPTPVPKKVEKALKRKKPWWGQRLCYMPYYAFIRDEKMWDRQMRKMGSDEPYPSQHAACVTTFHKDRDGGTRTICLLTMRDGWENYDRDALVALVAHEAVHIWQETEIDMAERNASPEFEAHTVQEIMANLLWSIEHVTGVSVNI